MSESCPVTNDVDDDVDAIFRPRLCQLKLWSDFDGYGFDLHVNDKNRINYVGKIERGSPAEAAGLKEGDRIVEVNGLSVAREPHDQIFALIKAMDDRVSLLVVDPATEQHFQQRDVIVDGRMKQVLRVTCPDVNPTPAAVAVATATDSADTELTKTEMHRARLCIVRSWHDGRGYGFAVNSGHDSSDYVVGSVDPGSPAAAAGLRAGDRLVEVNGVGVKQQMNHEAVAALINFDSNTVSLLVLDRDADKHFRERDIAVTSDMEHYVERITCPETKPEEKPPHGVRICHLRPWTDGCGYGFSMEAERGRPGHFIARVDVGSPADAVGLRVGDRVVEVDGDNVDEAAYQHVVDRVTAASDQLTLLVVDPDADKFFSEQNVAIAASMDCVETITCPENKPAASIETVNVVDGVNGTAEKCEEEPRTSNAAIGYVKVVETIAAKPSQKIDNETILVQVGDEVTVQMVEVSQKEEMSTSTSSAGPSTVELAATADEARRRMSKKKDVRSTTMSMKDKYDIFQKM